MVVKKGSQRPGKFQMINPQDIIEWLKDYQILQLIILSSEWKPVVFSGMDILDFFLLSPIPKKDSRIEWLI